MTEEDMILLREQKESAIDALSGNITEDQREQLTRLLTAIDDEMKHADEMPYSMLLHESMFVKGANMRDLYRSQDGKERK